VTRVVLEASCIEDLGSAGRRGRRAIESVRNKAWLHGRRRADGCVSVRAFSAGFRGQPFQVAFGKTVPLCGKRESRF